jgi:hypothetical protein
MVHPALSDTTYSCFMIVFRVVQAACIRGKQASQTGYRCMYSSCLYLLLPGTMHLTPLYHQPAFSGREFRFQTIQSMNTAMVKVLGGLTIRKEDFAEGTPHIVCIHTNHTQQVQKVHSVWCVYSHTPIVVGMCIHTDLAQRVSHVLHVLIQGWHRL